MGEEKYALTSTSPLSKLQSVNVRQAKAAQLTAVETFQKIIITNGESYSSQNESSRVHATVNYLGTEEIHIMHTNAKNDLMNLLKSYPSLLIQ